MLDEICGRVDDTRNQNLRGIVNIANSSSNHTLSSGIRCLSDSKISTSCAWRGLADSKRRIPGLADITIYESKHK